MIAGNREKIRQKVEMATSTNQNNYAGAEQKKIYRNSELNYD